MRPPGRRPGGGDPVTVQPSDQMAGARARVPLRFRGDGHAAGRTVANAGQPAGEQEEAQRDRVEAAADVEIGGIVEQR